jgi:hypothetical protein
MSIEESKTNELVRLKLDFVRPMAATNEVRFELSPSGDETEVTWSMEGKKGFIQKAACMVMDLDAMLGPQLEAGLKTLDTVAQEDAAKAKQETPAPADSGSLNE